MFKSAADSAFCEIEARRGALANLLSFGISYLDDTMIGIAPNDLILIGASSGIGKTQMCCNIALANLANGKRVHYFALEAERYEIERRLKYQILADMYFRDDQRPRLKSLLTYDKWALGAYLDELAAYEQRAAEFFSGAYKNLFLFYKGDTFGLNELIENVALHSGGSDLFIVDHVHYFDFDDDNENRAMREIAKMARTLSLESGKPIILVSHLRKRDKYNTDLVPGLEEFHGSSDLFKIATKVITIAPGMTTDKGNYETFFRIPKNRMNNGVTRYIGRLIFSPKVNAYEPQYKVGFAGCTRKDGFAEIDPDAYPEWARNARRSTGDLFANAQR